MRRKFAFRTAGSAGRSGGSSLVNASEAATRHRRKVASRSRQRAQSTAILRATYRMTHMHRLLVVVIALASVAAGCSGSSNESSEEPSSRPSTESSNVLLRRVDDPGVRTGRTPEWDARDRARARMRSPDRRVRSCAPKGTTLTSRPLSPIPRRSDGQIGRSSSTEVAVAISRLARSPSDWRYGSKAISTRRATAFRRAPRSRLNARGPMSVSPGMLVMHSVGPDKIEVPVAVGGRLALDVDRECILVSGKPVLWPNGRR